MPHDFDKFPELTNNQFDIYYFVSPHRQITEDFRAEVTRVIDGDTIQVKWYGRNFEFPIRLAEINAPEMKEIGGKESKSWLENKVLGKEIYVVMDPSNRVEKFGRLIGDVQLHGESLSEASLRDGQSTIFGTKNEELTASWV